MRFQTFINKHKMNIESIFDFCALCFEYLDSNIEDFELFAGEYLTVHENSERVNPNLEKLMKFQDRIFSYVRKELQHGKVFEEIVEQIVKWTSEMSDDLMLYGQQKENRITPVYYLLLAMDRYLGVREGVCRITSPMNKKYVKDVYVYFKPDSDIMSEAREQLNYGEYIEKRDINSDLQHMTAVSKKLFQKGREPLRIVPIAIRNKQINRIGKKLKIAVIPFNAEKRM